MKRWIAPRNSFVILVLLMAGCVSFPDAPPMTRTPELTANAFLASDGAALGLTVWRAENEIAIAAAAHGMNDYANAFALAAPEWAARGITTYAYDQRGFGRSPEKGRWPGAPALKQDLRDFVEAVRRANPDKPVFVVGHSMGAAVVMAAQRDRPLDADGIILAAPGVWGGAQLPILYRISLNIAASLLPGKTLTGESAGRQASDNIAFLRAMNEDPNVIKGTRLDTLLGAVRMMGEGWRASDDISGAFLVVYGEKDDIIPLKTMRKAAARLEGSVETKSYSRSWHLILADLERAEPLGDIADWIVGWADRKPPPPRLVQEQAVSNRP